MMRVMKKLFLLLLVAVTFVACQNDTPKSGVGASSSAMSAEDEHIDFQIMLKQRSRYGSLFDSIKSSFNCDLGINLDIFEDYVDGSGDYNSSLFADVREMLLFGGAGNSGDEFFY